MTIDRRRTKGWFWLPVALGFALRLAFILHAPRIAGDTFIYGDIAKNWMQHGVYGFADSAAGPVPTLIRLPGYPLFLALCFRIFGDDRYTAVMLVQCVIDLGICLLLSNFAKRLYGVRAGVVVLWLAVLCPFTANYVAAPLTETLTLACIVVAFYALERWRSEGVWNRWLGLIAVALAYSVLLRPEQGLMAVAILPAMFWLAWKQRGEMMAGVAPVAVVAMCIALPLVPWTVRNWKTFHVVEPLAPRYATDPGELVPRGFQRWFRSWAIEFASTENVYWNWDTASIDIDDIPARAFDSEIQYRRVEALLNAHNQSFNGTPEINAGFAVLADERIADDPVRYYVTLPFARLVNMALRPRVEAMAVDLQWWRWSRHKGQTLFAGTYALLNLGYFVLGFVGLWRWWLRRWDGHTALAWSMIAFFVLRCAMLLTLDNSEPRYTLEFFPLLVLWAGASFGVVRSKQAQV